MLTILKSAREWWFSVAVALAFISVLFAAFEAYELRALVSLSSDKTTSASGSLELSSKRLRLRRGDEITLDCPIGWCGYPGMGSDKGKFVTAYLADGRIVGVRGEGGHRDTLKLVINQKKDKILLYLAQLLLAGCIGWLAYKTRLKTTCAGA